VPAGDIGVGGREVGFMAGMQKKLTNNAACVFTGKGLSFGGSLIRPEATGYGTVYFAQEMLKTRGMSFEGLRVSVSGSGNVAQYAVEKAMQLGAKVVTVSDSSGTVIDEAGFTPEKLAILMDVKNHLYGRVSDYAERTGSRFGSKGVSQPRRAPLANAFLANATAVWHVAFVPVAVGLQLPAAIKLGAWPHPDPNPVPPDPPPPPPSWCASLAANGNALRCRCRPKPACAPHPTGCAKPCSTGWAKI
jgi:glutamate dehydrogenase/leucine dehydrogenase